MGEGETGSSRVHRRALRSMAGGWKLDLWFLRPKPEGWLAGGRIVDRAADRIAHLPSLRNIDAAEVRGGPSQPNVMNDATARPTPR